MIHRIKLVMDENLQQLWLIASKLHGIGELLMKCDSGVSAGRDDELNGDYGMGAIVVDLARQIGEIKLELDRGRTRSFGDPNLLP